MALTSTNPATGEVLATITEDTQELIDSKVRMSGIAFESWRNTSFQVRSKLMHSLSLSMRERRHLLATLITQEMGCPITQAQSEIEKCAQIIEFYADNSEGFLEDEIVTTNSKVIFQPLGTILHIAPWNYPFLLALRPVIPAIMAGNTVLLKHASNVPQISQTLQALFTDCGFPEGIFSSLMIGARSVAAVIAQPEVVMVTLIGSESAGAKVAAVAGTELKKTLMELGGSDPFIVFPDCDLELTVKAAVTSRLRNAGQSCNAAKRFIVHRSIVEEFTSRLKAEFEKQVIGDPINPETTLGPIANESGLDDILSQVRVSVEMGATIITGGNRIESSGYFMQPTILTNVGREMPVWKEETFGPVAAIRRFETVEEAINLANDNRYGLTASIWTQDKELASSLIGQIETGMVCVNQVARSDVKLPYGGVKKSGYGREFSHYGIKEFVNIKSVVV